ncbi:MAG: phosphoribosylanthranilate isomerase [Bacteroidetes bacterium]|nr:phosphoribosylanthranilate isomerase [Bacteroidota bacterium]
MKLKICGLKFSENIQAVAGLAPDYMGFIFWEQSPRFFTGNIPELPKNIRKTGVFVDAPIDDVREKIEKHQLQAVQLHGKETPEYCRQLATLKVEIIKVFSIGATFDFYQLEAYEEVCDFYLFDTKGKLPGGNGYVFDWEVLKKYNSPKPFFLSGGIGLDEVEQVKKIREADLPVYAIDVNSKFETEPGLKSIEKLHIFKKELIK